MSSGETDGPVALEYPTALRLQDTSGTNFPPSDYDVEEGEKLP